MESFDFRSPHKRSPRPLSAFVGIGVSVTVSGDLGLIDHARAFLGQRVDIPEAILFVLSGRCSFLFVFDLRSSSLKNLVISSALHVSFR